MCDVIGVEAKGSNRAIYVVCCILCMYKRSRLEFLADSHLRFKLTEQHYTEFKVEWKSKVNE